MKNLRMFVTKGKGSYFQSSTKLYNLTFTESLIFEEVGTSIMAKTQN